MTPVDIQTIISTQKQLHRMIESYVSTELAAGTDLKRASKLTYLNLSSQGLGSSISQVADATDET